MEDDLTNSVENLKEKINTMASLAKNSLERAMEALTGFDTIEAQSVINDDKAINALEISIDYCSYSILAMHSGKIPNDSLRQILSIQKINQILERIGDHAVNIAESAEIITLETGGCSLFNIKRMADKCKSMLHDALESFNKKDKSLARSVISRDDEVDALNESITEDVKASVLDGYNECSLEAAMEIIRICKDLERIADLSTNIAEETMFAEGKIAKHHNLDVERPELEISEHN